MAEVGIFQILTDSLRLQSWCLTRHIFESSWTRWKCGFASQMCCQDHRWTEYNPYITLTSEWQRIDALKSSESLMFLILVRIPSPSPSPHRQEHKSAPLGHVPASHPSLWGRNKRSRMIRNSCSSSPARRWLRISLPSLSPLMTQVPFLSPPLPSNSLSP